MDSGEPTTVKDATSKSAQSSPTLGGRQSATGSQQWGSDISGAPPPFPLPFAETIPDVSLRHQIERVLSKASSSPESVAYDEGEHCALKVQRRNPSDVDDSCLPPLTETFNFTDFNVDGSYGQAGHNEEAPASSLESIVPLSPAILAQLHDVLEGAASGDRPLTPGDISLISAFVSDLNPTAVPDTSDSDVDGYQTNDLEETASLAGELKRFPFDLCQFSSIFDV
jgi:hypothetical protein